MRQAPEEPVIKIYFRSGYYAASLGPTGAILFEDSLEDLFAALTILFSTRGQRVHE